MDDHLGALGTLSQGGSLQPPRRTPRRELTSGCRTGACKTPAEKLDLMRECASKRRESIRFKSTRFTCKAPRNKKLRRAISLPHDHCSDHVARILERHQ